MNIQPPHSSSHLTAHEIQLPSSAEATSTDQKIEAVSRCITTDQSTEGTKTITKEIVISQLTLKASIGGNLVKPKYDISHPMHHIRF